MIDQDPRKGAFLVEHVVAVLLLVLLVSMAWALLARHREVGRRLSHRASGLETIRTLGWVLGQETRSGRPGLDWEVVGSDSLSLRAFRGLALLDPDSWVGARVSVCFRGHRTPAPEKDSVLVLAPDGAWTKVDLRFRIRRPSGCEGIRGWEAEEWVLSEGEPGAVLGRLFERGSYHLSNEALRYMRGGGGRQPLTPEVLEEARFLGSGEGEGGVRWEVTLKGIPGDRGQRVDPASRKWRGGR